MSLSYFTKFGEAVWDLLLSDSSIHIMLFRVACTTAQALEVRDFVYLLSKTKEIACMGILTDLITFLCRIFM